MNVKTKLIGVAAALALPVSAVGALRAPAFTLEGTITDRRNGAPIAAATVSLVTARRSVTTDENGGFSFGQFQIPGTDQLLVSHAEYRTVRLPLGTLDTGAWRLEITVVPSAGVVGGDRPEEDPAR